MLKELLKTRMESIYKPMFRVRHSLLGERIVHAQRRYTFSMLQRLNGDVCAFDIAGAIGFGGTLSHIVTLLDYCDQHNFRPSIRISNPLYRDHLTRDRSWFDYYFLNKSDVRNFTSPLRHATIETLDDYPRPTLRLNSIARANNLFFKYISIKPELIEIANRFSERNLGERALGVHYRGTDKIAEAPRVRWDKVCESVRKAIDFFPDTDIVFVTSDEKEFILFMQAQNVGRAICTYDCHELSHNGAAIHFSGGDRRRKGVEALTTMLILAKCGTVIRTPSHLSAWANIFNPVQNVIMLEKPHDAHMHFPECAIWDNRLQITL